MPLYGKARVEAYLPDVPRPAYRELLSALEQEFSYAFGGCTVLRGLEGTYLSRLGATMRDRLNLIYADAPFAFEEHFATIERYTDAVRDAVLEALEEEAVLIVAAKVYHAEPAFVPRLMARPRLP